MPPKMSVPKALWLLEAHAEEHGVLFIDEHLFHLADSIWCGIQEGLFDRTLAEAIAVVWNHYKQRASEIDLLPGGESVLGLDSVRIDPWGDHGFQLLAAVEVDPNLFGNLPAEEEADE